ncbi:hypothetical protein ABPG74_009205 [Tetrahymena malaccensis]
MIQFFELNKKQDHWIKDFLQNVNLRIFVGSQISIEKVALNQTNVFHAQNFSKQKIKDQFINSSEKVYLDYHERNEEKDCFLISEVLKKLKNIKELDLCLKFSSIQGYKEIYKILSYSKQIKRLVIRMKDEKIEKDFIQNLIDGVMQNLNLENLKLVFMLCQVDYDQMKKSIEKLNNIGNKLHISISFNDCEWINFDYGQQTAHDLSSHKMSPTVLLSIQFHENFQREFNSVFNSLIQIRDLKLYLWQYHSKFKYIQDQIIFNEKGCQTIVCDRYWKLNIETQKSNQLRSRDFCIFGKKKRQNNLQGVFKEYQKLQKIIFTTS